MEQQAKSRLQELVPIRYARMLVSPFAFLRGSAAIMAADLASTRCTGLKVQLCGDMHVGNFGLFASAERNLIFGINDFDETLPGPWECDMKRLVTSIVVCGRYLGLGEIKCREGVMAAVRSYRKHMKEYTYMGRMQLNYTSIHEQDVLNALPTQVKEVKKIMDKAHTRTHLQMLDKLTDVVDHKYRLRDNPPLIVHETKTQSGRSIENAMDAWLRSYLPSLADDRRALLSQYRIVDVVRKVVGVGSVGMRCWIIFLTDDLSDDPLFLQVKEADASVPEPFVPKSVYSNHGERVVAGQRLIQGAPDILLGWGQQDGIHFYVQQLRE